MIYVERDQADETGTPIRPSEPWFHQAADSTETAIQEQGEHNAQRNVYAHDEVKTALERLFRMKCAYCEMKVTATADWEVEHYRPKGRVAEREDHPGYYWLTYAWDNLYLSCQHCNQRRRDRLLWGDALQLPSGGKGDHFPLFDESTRAMEPADDVLAEHTLVIDPCFDDPEDYLGYDPTGQVFSLSKNPYGEETITVLHLGRSRLRERRREQIVIATYVLKLRARANAADLDLRDELQNLLDSMQSEKAEFSGLVRYIAAHPAHFGI